MTLTRYVFVMLGLLCVWGPACAPEVEESVRLAGEVSLDDEAAPDGIQVHLSVGGEVLIASTTTNTEGQFVFEGVSQVSYEMTFIKEGYLTITIPATWNGSSHTLNGGGPIFLASSRTARLSGQLISTRIDPDRGGDWSAEVKAARLLDPQGLQVSAVTVQNDGGISLPQAVIPGEYRLQIEVDGHLSLSQQQAALTLVDGDNDQGEIALVEEVDDVATRVALRGLVDLDGVEDESGVQVVARVNGELHGSTFTAQNGAFFIETSRLRHTLSFSKEGFVALAGVEVIWVDVEEEAEGGHFEVDGQRLAEVRFALEPVPAATLRGTVSSALGELNDWPNRAFVILISEDNQQRRIEPVANADEGRGQFQLVGLSPGEYSLDIVAQGHIAHNERVTLLEGDNDLGDRELAAQRFDGEAPVVMRGRACKGACDEDTDHSGIVVRASIGVNPAGITITDEAGAFALNTVGDNHRLELQAEGFISQTQDVLWSEVEEAFFLGDTPLEGSPIVLAQVPTATLAGAVASSQGPRSDWPNIAFVTLTGEGQRRVVGVDNADEGQGQFQIAGLPLGTYALSINAQGHISQAIDVTLGEGDNALDAPVVLQAEDNEAGVVMLGQIQLQGEEGDEADHSGVVVSASVQGNTVATSQTNIEGEFAFLTSRQDHALSFSRQNFITRTVDVTWDEGDEHFEIGGVRLSEAPIALSLEAQSDRDFDGVIDTLDNCVRRANPNQQDVDGDGQGDACDSDADDDGMINGLDNCPFSHNPMQEDPSGEGRGVACSGGTASEPFMVGCGVERQHLDTRERSGQLQGNCGGAGAPEVVYRLSIEEGEVWTVQVRASHAVAIYLRDLQGQEVDCVVGALAEFGGQELSSGQYELVIDGFSRGEVGPMEVSIQSTRLCEFDLGLRTNITRLSPQAETIGLKLAKGDLNGDGHLDVLAFSRDSAHTLLNNGRGVLSHTTTSTFSVRVIDRNSQDGDPVLADINGDGHLDIVATSSSPPSTVRTLLGDGLGNFTNEASYPAPGTSQLIAGDVDGDADVDIIAVHSGSVFLNDGLGRFAVARSFGGSCSDSSMDVALGDVNSDGALDLATPCGLYLGDGQGDFERIMVLGGQAIAFGDVNGDGHLDINITEQGSPRCDQFLCAYPDSHTRVLLGDGLGGFTEGQRILAGGQGDVSVMEDMNGDGHLDIVMTAGCERCVTVMWGNGLGGFTEQIFEVDQYISEIVSFAVGDFDGDGLRDIVVHRRFDDSRELRVIFGEGLARSREVVTSGRSETVSVDFDGDGHLDLVSNNNRPVSLGQGRGTLTPLPVDHGLGGYEIRVGDVDEDGRPDVITGLFQRSDEGGLGLEDFYALHMHLGTGQGNIGPSARLEMGSDPRFIDLVDIDRDGHLDIITSTTNSFGQPNTVSTWLGNGRGAFPTERRSSNLSEYELVQGVVGDMNGDGHLDLVTSYRRSDIVRVMLGDGQGTFTEAHTPFDASSNRGSIHLGDLNGDSHLDLVVVETFPNNVTVWPGDGLGRFPTESRVTVVTDSDDPNSVLLGDLNGDGHTDLIVGGETVGDDIVLSVRFGGGGALTQPTVLTTADVATPRSLGDYNNDGIPDLVAALGDGTVLLLSRTRLKAGTRLADSALPPCRPLSVSARAGTFSHREEAPCRIDRLELDLSFAPDALGTLSTRTPMGHSQTLATLPDERGEPGLIRPEVLSSMARFQGHPLNGLWSLDAPFDLESAQMVVNTYPEDPFDPDTLVDACTPDTDQLDEPDFVCRLEGASLEGLLLEDDADEDVFLLEGDLDGAFTRGQTLNVFVVTDGPRPGLNVSLRAFRAAGPIEVAEEIAPGQWALSFTVPPQYSGRYFSIHVGGEGITALGYDLSFEEGEPFEFRCGDGLDDDGNGLVDCQEQGCAQHRACDEDDDDDGVLDVEDNCISVPNVDQTNTDDDRFGDACDEDDDDDGLSDLDEEALGSDPLLADTDGDGLNDGREVELQSDPLSDDTDGDGLLDGEDACLNDDDNDGDNDGVCGDVDNCPQVANGACTELPEATVAWWPEVEAGIGDADAILVLGATTAPGIQGQAFSLPGSRASRVKLPHTVLDGLRDFTVAMWVKTTDTGSGIFSAAANNDNDNELLIQLAEVGRMTIYIKGVAQSFDTPGVNDGQFHHLALTRRGADVTFFFDGQPIVLGNISTTAPLVVAPNGLMLGQDQDDVDGGFDISQAYNGLIDEVFISNEAITAEQALDLLGGARLDYCPGGLGFNQADSDNDGIGDACRAVATPIGEPVTLRGALDNDDPQWARPSETCGAEPGADHFFETFEITNNTGSAQQLILTASWEGDGYLHVFETPFDPTDLDNCITGNDDLNFDTLQSQLTDLTIAAGQRLTVVASTFAPNQTIGPYTIEILTQP